MYMCLSYQIKIIETPAKKQNTMETIREFKTEFVMVLLVIMRIVLALMETVMDPVGLYW